MIRAEVQADGRLKITADNEGRKELAWCYVYPDKGYQAAENEVAERLAENGFLFCDPSNFGALTDSPIIADGQPDYAENIWWYPNYQITDPWQELKDRGRVFFDPEENNKSLPKTRGEG